MKICEAHKTRTVRLGEEDEILGNGEFYGF